MYIDTQMKVTYVTMPNTFLFNVNEVFNLKLYKRIHTLKQISKVEIIHV